MPSRQKPDKHLEAIDVFVQQLPSVVLSVLWADLLSPLPFSSTTPPFQMQLCPSSQQSPMQLTCMNFLPFSLLLWPDSSSPVGLPLPEPGPKSHTDGCELREKHLERRKSSRGFASLRDQTLHSSRFSPSTGCSSPFSPLPLPLFWPGWAKALTLSLHPAGEKETAGMVAQLIQTWALCLFTQVRPSAAVEVTATVWSSSQDELQRAQSLS